jgi:hypothetical protein
MQLSRQESGRVHIQHFVFEFNPRIQRTVAQPLSWHLTQTDKDEIIQQIAERDKLATQAADRFAALLTDSTSAATECTVTVE